MRAWCGFLMVIGACSSDVTSSRDIGDVADSADLGVLIPHDGTDGGGDATEVRETVSRTDSATETEDTFVEDTLVADTLVADTSVEPDTSPADDTLVADTFVEDTFVEDTFVEDTFVEDTFVADTVEVVEDVIDPDNNVPGILIYQKVPNIIATDDLLRVKWHPSGDYALLFGRKNEVFRYDAEARTIASAGKLGAASATLNDIEVGAEGYFLIAGVTASQSTIWKVTLGDVDAVPDQLVIEDTITVPTGTAVSITYERFSSPSRFAIAANSGNNFISYLYLYATDTGLGNPKGFNTEGGMFDLLWADPALTAGSAAIITAEGISASNSQTWVLDSNLIVGNGWPGSFGNAGRGDWRPRSAKTAGGYGIICGWSSNKLYVYDGAWVMGELPVPTGAAPQAIDWRDHRRALVVGRVIGVTPYATVIEVRAGESVGWASATLVNQSIPSFSSAPWFGNTSSMHLNDVDWRPGVACDEGLIVGSDNGTQFSPTFGTIARFYDSDDPACVP